MRFNKTILSIEINHRVGENGHFWQEYKDIRDFILEASSPKEIEDKYSGMPSDSKIMSIIENDVAYVIANLMRDSPLNIDIFSIDDSEPRTGFPLDYLSQVTFYEDRDPKVVEALVTISPNYNCRKDKNSY